MLLRAAGGSWRAASSNDSLRRGPQQEKATGFGGAARDQIRLASGDLRNRRRAPEHGHPVRYRHIRIRELAEEDRQPNQPRSAITAFAAASPRARIAFPTSHQDRSGATTAGSGSAHPSTGVRARAPPRRGPRRARARCVLQAAAAAPRSWPAGARPASVKDGRRPMRATSATARRPPSALGRCRGSGCPRQAAPSRRRASRRVLGRSG